MKDKTVVVKVGTGYLFNANNDGYLSLDTDNWGGLVEELAAIQEYANVALVSSGAIRMALMKKNLPEKPRSVEEKARLSGRGQHRLMAEYAKRFDECDIDCAQYLVTRYDFENDASRLNIQNQQKKYFDEGIICIYNENDLIATDEIKFGDNDGLVPELAKCIGADLAIMLSDPSKHLGTGGGDSKVKAKKELSDAGIPLEIINGRYELSECATESKYLPKIRSVLDAYGIKRFEKQ